MQASNNRKRIRGCTLRQANPFPCFFEKQFKISAQTEPERKCTHHVPRVTFRLVRLLPVGCVTGITRRVYCRQQYLMA